MISILPHVLSLTESILFSCRSNILYEMLESFEQDGKYGSRDYSILDNIIAMAGANWATEASLISFLPNSVQSVIDKWKSIDVVHIPWVNIKNQSNFHLFEGISLINEYFFHANYRTLIRMTLYQQRATFWLLYANMSVHFLNIRHFLLIRH